jgi:hypothetical protein
MITILKGRKHSATNQQRRRTNEIQKADYGREYPVYEYRQQMLEGEISIQIDVERLVSELGTTALRSKGKKAVEASGAVVVTVRNIREVSGGEWKKHYLYSNPKIEEAK